MDEKILEKEQAQLERTQKVIAKHIEQIDKVIAFREGKIRETLDYASSEKLDRYELADVYGAVRGREISIEQLNRDKSMFQRITPKPFFAKITFAEIGGQPESYYIGLKNIADGDDQIVIDWRTPMASLLYFSSLGKTSFTAPMGKIDVDLMLKRQFRLEPNKIVWYVDTNTKIDDNILQEILSQNTSSHMSNIVQTIQEEQNAIIRKPAQQTVIINGIAGSGKTSIAMHRISYILYSNKGNIASKNVLVVSPNRLFSTYIGDLLPELGEENVYACPMMQVLIDSDLAPKKCGSKISMVDNQFIDKARKNEIDKKYSIAFFDEVQRYLEDFDLAPYAIDAFNENGYNIPDEHIRAIPTKKITDIASKIESLVYGVLIKEYPRVPDRLLQKAKNKIVMQMKKIITAELIMDKMYMDMGLHYGEGEMGYEDAPIYSYINAQVKGVSPNYFIRHIFVDEMQDYDPFSIYLLKKIYPDAIMTLAGDYNQNLLSNQSNLEMLKRLFPNVKVDNLDVSYRSTNEIIEFAQKIVNGKIDARLVRHGDQPKVMRCDTADDFVTQVRAIVEAYPNDKIAVIAKTLTEANKLAKILKDFTFIRDERDDALLTSDKIITTTYLSKGLEYDRVILSNVDNENYSTDLDKQNLYVACTRALHGLYLTYSHEVSKFVPDIGKKKQIEKSKSDEKYLDADDELESETNISCTD